MNKERIPLERARNHLSTIWFIGAALPFVILAVQSLLGKYGESVQQVWAWFIPTVFPTSALMLGVIGATALQEGYDERAVKSYFFKLSRGFALFYLIVLLGILFVEPASPMHGMDLFNMANYFLAPLQGLVVAAVTVLFTSQEKDSIPPPAV
jgi:hypothetical protein